VYREKIILKWTLKAGLEGVGGIHLAQVRDKWQVFVYTVMKTMVP
jgi:hypothetical protein